MSRTPRRSMAAEFGCYHILNRGHNRQRVFGDDGDSRKFLELLARYRDRFALHIYHYCLLSNHFHLVLQLDRPRDLSRCMAGLLRAYGHWFGRRWDYVGPLWQGRFKSFLLETDTYLLTCGRYVERNPVEAGMVASPWDYAWSSCRSYANGVKDPLLAANRWYEALGRNLSERQTRWQEILREPDVREEAMQGQEWAVGSAAFRREAEHAGSRPQPRRRGRPLGDARPTHASGKAGG